METTSFPELTVERYIELYTENPGMEIGHIVGQLIGTGHPEFEQIADACWHAQQEAHSDAEVVAYVNQRVRDWT